MGIIKLFGTSPFVFFFSLTLLWSISIACEADMVLLLGKPDIQY